MRQPITDHTILALPDAVKLIREQEAEIARLDDVVEDLKDKITELKVVQSRCMP